jgi:hypothetical protein
VHLFFGCLGILGPTAQRLVGPWVTGFFRVGRASRAFWKPLRGSRARKRTSRVNPMPQLQQRKCLRDPSAPRRAPGPPHAVQYGVYMLF